MKLKNLACLTIFLLLQPTIRSMAQSYLPFPEQGGIWGSEHSSIICLNGITAVCYVNKTVTNGDTIINGLKYVKLLERSLQQDGGGWLALTGIYNAGFLRNDSINKRVYYKETASSNDTLLYDFNLEVGDTLPVSMVYDPQQSVITVDNIDTITENEVMLRRYHLDHAGWGDSYLIEGVGSTLGLFSPIVPFFEFTWDLVCYYNYEKMISWGSGWCDQIIVDVQGLSEGKNLSVYPNPFNNTLNINYSNKDHEIISVEIYNSIGQKNFSQNILHFPFIVNTTGFLPGIYMMNMYRSGKQVSFKKLVKI